MLKTIATAGLLGGFMTASWCWATPDPEERCARRECPDGAVRCDGVTAPADRERPLDPAVIFDQLVERYRALDTYQDHVRVSQVTERDGTSPLETATAMTCTIDEGELSVKTPQSAAREKSGLKVPLRVGPTIKSIRQRYFLWLAPHMTLKFSEQPLQEFRSGVEEGFTPTEAKNVTRNNKSMVHLELKSGDGLSEDSEATFDLYIDAESGLIEHIEGDERLADGANCHTTMEITPVMNGTPGSAEPQPESATTTPAPEATPTTPATPSAPSMGKPTTAGGPAGGPASIGPPQSP